jgi:hypothetical protein
MDISREDLLALNQWTTQQTGSIDSTDLTPDCLDPDQLYYLATHDRSTPEAVRLWKHIEIDQGGCSLCKVAYAELSADLFEAKTLLAAEPPVVLSSPVSTPPVQLASLPWFQRFRFAFGMGTGAALAAACLGLLVLLPAQNENQKIREEKQRLLTELQTNQAHTIKSEQRIGDADRLLRAERSKRQAAEKEQQRLAQLAATAEQQLKEAGQERAVIRLQAANLLKAAVPESVSRLGKKARVAAAPTVQVPEVTVLPPSPETTAVQQQAITLKWQPVEGAAAYLITVIDEDDENAAPVFGPERLSARQTERRNIAVPLGNTYFWELKALDAKGKILARIQRGFVALKESEIDAVNARLEKIPGQSLERALVLRKAGLVLDAYAELGAIPADDPRYAPAQRLARDWRREDQASRQ